MSLEHAALSPGQRDGGLLALPPGAPYRVQITNLDSGVVKDYQPRPGTEQARFRNRIAVGAEAAQEQSAAAALLGAQMEYRVVRPQPSTDLYVQDRRMEEPKVVNDSSIGNLLWTEGSQ